MNLQVWGCSASPTTDCEAPGLLEVISQVLFKGSRGPLLCSLDVKHKTQNRSLFNGLTEFTQAFDSRAKVMSAASNTVEGLRRKV